MLPPFILLLIPTDWSRLLGERERYERHQYAETTNQTRSVQVQAYLAFCEEYVDQVEPYPCNVNQVCLYMVYLARRLCFSSIRNYISALNNHLKDLGYTPVDYECHAVRKCLRGIRRVKGDGVRQAEPLLPGMLKRMFATMQATAGHVAVRAAMLVSFRALLRKCHVTASDSTILRGDVVFHGWGLMLHIRKSKTVQFGERVHKIPVVRVRDVALCAVHWVEEHFRQCPAPAEARAFRVPRGGYSVPLEYSYYLGVIKCICGRSGLDSSLFSTHSLRRGGATYLRMCGASLQEIKERGNWKSDVVYQYLQLSLVERLALDKRVAMCLEGGGV